MKLLKPIKPRKQHKKVKPKSEKQYKVRNWKEYNQALVDRGKVTFWITEKALEAWEEQQKTGKRGKPKLYSNVAIETAITLQQVFHLPLRQVEGFLSSILTKTQSDRKAPDYSTLSVRGVTLDINIRVRPIKDEPLHLVVDSTGAKVYGEGEWKVRQHGWGKHRTWKKLHIGIDQSNGDILVGEVTGNEVSDAHAFGPLINQIPVTTIIDQVSTDGIYDKKICYDKLAERGVLKVAIPPQKNARIHRHGNLNGPPLIRDQNIRRIREIGRSPWKKEIHFHRRSLSETGMFRLKTLFSDKVRNRNFAGQRVELLLRCKALNLINTLGMPQSYVVA